MNPQGGVALVTGANKGLGTEVARKLVRRGYTVYLGSRELARGGDAAVDPPRVGLNITAIELDVTDVESVGRAAARIMQEHGRLDVLVNNAGFHVGAPALEMTNVFGLVCVTSAMLPLLRRSTEARIVNIASTRTGTRGSESDASAKAAVTMLTVQYANALKRRPEYAHIQVKAVTAAYVATDLDSHAGPCSVEEGTRVVMELATLSDEGQSGVFFKR
jgi:NAD(P)-dependent dehydrogenase (short-subunit alcohol dehydrogenase family)